MFITRKRFEEEIRRAEERAFERACREQRTYNLERDMWRRCDELEARICRLEIKGNENS